MMTVASMGVGSAGVAAGGAGAGAAPIRSVAIIGKGALGLMYADAITRALGPDAVRFVMDDVHYRRHEHDVVHVNGEERSFASMRACDARPVDLVIVAVKSGALDEALDLMAPLMGDATRVLSLLNGITSEERIAARYGWERLPICVAQGMDAVRTGSDLTYSKMGQLRFGVASQGTDPTVVSEVATFLESAGIPHVVEADVLHRLWAKFMLNVGVNQACMVFGGTYGSVSDQAGEQFRVFVSAMREVVAVANAEGIILTEDDLAGMVGLIATLDPEGMPSMAQDRLAGRPSEVAEFSGALIERAERHGILVPMNRWLNARIHEIEATYGAC